MRPYHIIRQPKFSEEILKLNKPIKYIAFLIFIYTIGWGIVEPILPVYFNNIFNSYTSVGLIISALQFFSMIWALLLGTMLDKVKKRSLITIVLLFYLPLSPILLALKTIAQFIVFRIYHSFIATSLWATSEAYVREHTEKNKEAESIGLFDFGVGAAFVIGGAIGALATFYYGFNVIYAVSIFASIAFLLSLFLPDRKKKQSIFMCIATCLRTKKLKEEISHLKQHSKFRSLILYAFPFFFCISFMPMIMPLFITSIGAPLHAVGIISALFYFPVLFESYFSTQQHKHRVMTLGLISSAILFLTLFFVDNITVTFLLTLLLGISFAAAMPIISGRFTSLMPRKEIGEFSALVFATKSLAAALAPLVAGFLADKYGLNFVFLLGAVIFSILLLFRKHLQ